MSVHSFGSQGSGVLRSMSEANCVVVLHHDQGPVAVGDPVDCVAFEGLVEDCAQAPSSRWSLIRMPSSSA